MAWPKGQNGHFFFNNSLSVFYLLLVTIELYMFQYQKWVPKLREHLVGKYVSAYISLKIRCHFKNVSLA